MKYFCWWFWLPLRVLLAAFILVGGLMLAPDKILDVCTMAKGFVRAGVRGMLED